MGYGARRFHGNMLGAGRGKDLFKDLVRLSKSFLNISLFHTYVITEVGSSLEIDRQVRQTLWRHSTGLMQDRRSLGQCLLRVHNSGQFLVVHFDQFQCLFGNFRSRGSYCCHRIADKAHPVDGNDGLILHDGAVVGFPGSIVPQVVLSQHDGHASQFSCTRVVNVDDPGVRQRAAQNLGVEHSAYLQVIQIRKFSGDLVFALQPGYGLSDDRFCLHG